VNELDLTIGALMFILGWYGLSKLVGRLSRGLQSSRLVWCSRVKTFSLVKIAPGRGNGGAPGKVHACLLWPEFQDCDRRCIRINPVRFKRRANASRY